MTNSITFIIWPNEVFIIIPCNVVYDQQANGTSANGIMLCAQCLGSNVGLGSSGQYLFRGLAIK